ncbi:MAG TPA: squalene synthase HpnC [Methylophilus sp.]|nr:squalene synthase HpnC [Methylophilus sp.]HQQ33582.1 squalene synthase HpnC [Methylophilus sp.]
MGIRNNSARAVKASNSASRQISKQNESLAHEHYENFPVASIALPKHLRGPIALIYTFARQADDLADEGHHKPEKRLAMLQGYRNQLDLIAQKKTIKSPFFKEVANTVEKYQLPLQPFYDLLDAFSQDVVKTRYANFVEVLDYCRRSANPIGALLLHLFGKATPENIIYSNKICTALQLINFYQDIAIDFEKPLNRSRIYLCQDEMEQFGVTEAQIAAQYVNRHWEEFMLFNIERAEQMLLEGKPLEHILPGRIGLEMRMIIGGGERIIYKLRNVRGDVFKHRPTLKAWDWPVILLKALLR